MKFLFLLLLFLNIIFCEHFVVNDVVYISTSFKTSNIFENESQVFERSIAQLHNDLYYNNELVI